MIMPICKDTDKTRAPILIHPVTRELNNIIMP